MNKETEFLRKKIAELSEILETRVAELSVVRELGLALKVIGNFNATCHAILDVIVRNTMARNFSVMMLDELRQQLFLVAASDPENRKFVESSRNIIRFRGLNYKFQHGQGIAGQCLASGKPICIENAKESHIYMDAADSTLVIGSILAVPMFYDDKVIGVLNFSHPEVEVFHEKDIHLLLILSDIITLILCNSLNLEKLHISEAQYRALSEHSNDGIAIIRGGRHLYANARYQELSGYSSEELEMHHTFCEIISGFGEKDEHNFGLEVNANPGERLLEAVLTRKDGRKLEVELNAATTLHDEGDALIVSVRDISFKKHLERQLRQFQKMEAIGTIASGVAHDFNNILAAIIGYTELAMHKLDEESTGKQHLKQVLKAGERAKELIKQILAFSRQTEQTKKPVMCDLIIKETLKLLRATVSPGIDIQKDVDSGCVVCSDPTLIQQIIMNLCVNATQAMKDGSGVLRVSVKKVSVDEQDSSLQLEPGQYVLISVSDTGEGIAPAVIDRIFDPYFTTKDQGQGTGIGLAVVLGIVKGHNGTITVQSEPGHGTCFEVYLPGIAERISEVTARGHQLPRGHEHIMFVDDEESLIVMGGEVLSMLGYRVSTFRYSNEALRAFRANPNIFDLIITDQGMPHMKGTELIREIRQINQEVPIIVCTGYSEGITDEMRESLGIIAVLRKPLLIRDFAANIRVVLEEGGMES